MAYGLDAAARRNPTGVAVTDEAVEWTWPQLNSMVNRAVGWLLSAGIGAGQRIGVFAENGTYTALAHLAATYAGLSVVPINYQLTPAEVRHILDDAAVHTVLCSAGTAAVARAASERVRVIAWGTGESDGIASLERLLERYPDVEPSPEIAPAAPLYYTSGTTGVPKGVRLPDQMFPGGRTMIEHVERIEGSPVRPTGRHLVVGPMHHTGPIGGVRGLTVGNPLVVLRKFDAERVLRLIERYRIEGTMMVPTHFSRLLALSEQVRNRYDISSIRTIVHTGAPCPVLVKRAMIAWFGPVLREAYGSTEVGTVTMIDSAEWLAHPGSVGRVMPGYELTIRDERGAVLGAGEQGLVCVRSLIGAQPSYHNDPDKTRRSYIAEDVFVVGEIGFLDEEGYLYLTDRASDMVVSGGVNVYPAEAETVLRAHPGVFDVAVIGIPHADLGEQLCALVVAGAARPTAEELIAWCRDRLAHYKCPARVEFVDTELRSAMGKIDKRRLRREYLARRGAVTAGGGE
ncbi:AMP-binding protein [Nocardia sp. CDC159]|uniref:AMP-binding protein n=1 Tax=Nocardia pulmonis TaxID=2951408 RepID=A0A9X2E1P7_9NOCA|nr:MULTISPECIES: AMP-binding protein [Nocardia]MCM6772559.1 AMP-binding protein [Nocardia pulmonis]MCM6784783.1 AMP-binding protein [Nocardia sp. CDC159]